MTKDYGLGTFKNQPLVQVVDRCYHRAGHFDGAVTFTERFAAEFWRPCRICFPWRPREVTGPIGEWTP